MTATTDAFELAAKEVCEWLSDRLPYTVFPSKEVALLDAKEALIRILRKHFQPPASEPAPVQAKDVLTESDPVGWYECEYINSPHRYTKWWTGSMLTDFPTAGQRAVGDKHFTNFRGPLVVAGEQPQPQSIANHVGTGGHASELPLSIAISPSGDSRCPECGNSFQNESPADRKDLLRCASCKLVFRQASEPDKESDPSDKPIPPGLAKFYRRGASQIGELFCWCVENLDKFPPIKGEWIDEVKRRLKATDPVQASEPRYDEHGNRWQGFVSASEPSEVESLKTELAQLQKDESGWRDECQRLRQENGVFRNLYGCPSCGENHPPSSMCPPHEVRTTGQESYRETVGRLLRELTAVKHRIAEMKHILATLAGWKPFPYAMVEDGDFKYEWCPPGERVHVSKIKPLPPPQELKVAIESRIAELESNTYPRLITSGPLPEGHLIVGIDSRASGLIHADPASEWKISGVQMTTEDCVRDEDGGPDWDVWDYGPLPHPSPCRPLSMNPLATGH